MSLCFHREKSYHTPLHRNIVGAILPLDYINNQEAKALIEQILCSAKHMFEF